MEKAIIVDIDGTILDPAERLQLCQAESNNKKTFWNCFQSEKYLYTDKPILKTIQLIRKYFEEGIRIIIVTGRSKNMKNYTLIQLSSFGVFWNQIYFREEGNFKKDYEYKDEIVQKLKAQFEILFAIDDSAEVRKVLQEHGIKAIDPNLISL